MPEMMSHFTDGLNQVPHIIPVNMSISSSSCPSHTIVFDFKKRTFTLLDVCLSFLRKGHANLLCIVVILTDDPRRESNLFLFFFWY